jgi:hypothetical protein
MPWEKTSSTVAWVLHGLQTPFWPLAEAAHGEAAR